MRNMAVTHLQDDRRETSAIKEFKAPAIKEEIDTFRLHQSLKLCSGKKTMSRE